MIPKTECVRGRVFATRAEANLALFEYIDSSYDSRGIQERLGLLSPLRTWLSGPGWPFVTRSSDRQEMFPRIRSGGTVTAKEPRPL